jgi:hypothetical protein
LYIDDNVDDNLSKFDIDMEDDDYTKMDIMPPPIFSRANIPNLYKYLPRTPSPAFTQN